MDSPDEGTSDRDAYLKHFHKTVTDDTFRDIFRRVWENWYKAFTDPDEGGYWDDQDLVRFLLTGNLSENDSENDEPQMLIRPTFAGIFCDESQDFTRIELETILRLSLFSDRKINPDQIPYLPFAFAGDEFQTLNPTGFRWDAIKAWFTEKFIHALDPKNQMSHKVNFVDLKNNYRSLAPIVRFGNRVQLMRMARFGMTGLEPQKIWNVDEGRPVVYFPKEDRHFWNNIPQGAVLIVPCDDGEAVSDYISEKLKNHITLDDDNTPVEMTVLSATEAKGSEYDCVVVYGFAEKDVCPQGILSPLLSDRAKQNLSSSIEIPNEYFINKVYVSVTRARKLLIILDDFKMNQNDPHFFWNFALDSQDDLFRDKLLQKVKEPAWKEPEVLTTMHLGKEIALKKDMGFSVEDVAKDLAEKGHRGDNIGLLRQAAKKYHEIKKVKDAEECLAQANCLEGNFQAAGDRYKTLGQYEKAINCYWLLENKVGWKEITSFEDSMSDVRIRFSVLLRNKRPTYQQTISVLKETRDHFREHSDKILEKEPWEKAIHTLLEQVELKSTKDGISALNEIVNICRDIEELKYSVVWKPLIQQASKTEQHKLVLDLCEASPEYHHLPEYNEAKAKTAPYPENIEFLAKIPGAEKLILKQFQENYESKNDDPELVQRIFDAAIACKRFDLMEKILPLVSSTGVFQSMEKTLRDKNESAWAGKCGILKIVSSLRQQGSAAAWDNVFSQKWFPKYSLTITRALARSEMTNTSQKVSDTLKQLYLNGSLEQYPPGICIEIGAAIERAGRRIDALSFYEKAEQAFFADTLYAQEFQKRWIACKERQAEHSQNPKEAERRKSEAQLKRESIGLGTKKIPQYPQLSPWSVLYKDIVSGEWPKTPPLPPEPPPVDDGPGTTVLQPPVKGKKDDPQPQPPEKPGPVTGPDIANLKPKVQSPVEFEHRGLKFTFYHETERLNIDRSSDGGRVQVLKGIVSSCDFTLNQSDDGWCTVEDAELQINVSEYESIPVVIVHDIKYDIGLAFPASRHQASDR